MQPLVATYVESSVQHLADSAKMRQPWRGATAYRATWRRLAHRTVTSLARHSAAFSGFPQASYRSTKSWMALTVMTCS